MPSSRDKIPSSKHAVTEGLRHPFPVHKSKAGNACCKMDDGQRRFIRLIVIAKRSSLQKRIRSCSIKLVGATSNCIKYKRQVFKIPGKQNPAHWSTQQVETNQNNGALPTGISSTAHHSYWKEPLSHCVYLEQNKGSSQSYSPAIRDSKNLYTSCN
jgi:hypothetical protein